MTRILVIEDEAHILENILETLEMEGFDVHGLNDGREALATALTYKPDLILCDIMMPDVDGYNVLINLRSEPATSTIPFVFLTALAARAEMRHGMEMGADDYLTKPFTPTELLSAVNARLEKQEIIKDQHEKQLTDLRQNIVYALPHELRTPLTGIIGCADYLLHDYNNVDRSTLQNLADVMMRSANRLSTVIENYLLYAQLEVYGQDQDRIEKLKRNSIDYPEAVIQETLQLRAFENDRTDDIHFDLNTASIAISHDNFTKIITELVDNALKFSKAGTEINVHSETTDDGMYRVSIEDQGRGMTPEQINQVGAYMQFDRVLNEQQGLGLGLAISTKMAKLHGGDIQIKSEAGVGTTITVFLPLTN